MPAATPDVRVPECSHRAAIRDLALAARSLMTQPRQGAEVQDSRLTPSGQAAELACLWPGPDYRISLDPCPGAPPRTRLAICANSVAASLSPRQSEVLEMISGWQQAHGARFGAWLGLRLRNGTVARKLYLDIPSQAPWAVWEERLAGAVQVRSSRGAVATMVGLDPVTGGTEVYYSAGRLHPADIPVLAARIGLTVSPDCVSTLVQDLTGRSLRFGLPSFDMGFSNSWAAEGSPAAFTWYSTAVGLLGPDDRVRSALLSAGAKRGWDMSAYADLTTGSPPRHVLLGAALPAASHPAYTATIATTPDVLLNWAGDAGVTR